MTGTIHMLVGDTILETRQYHSLKEQQLIIFAFKKMGASAVQVAPRVHSQAMYDSNRDANIEWKKRNPMKVKYYWKVGYCRRKGIPFDLTFSQFCKLKQGCTSVVR